MEVPRLARPLLRLRLALVGVSDWPEEVVGGDGDDCGKWRSVHDEEVDVQPADPGYCFVAFESSGKAEAPRMSYW